MSDREEFRRCKKMSLAEFRLTGGCHWRRKNNSPGHDLRIPNGTPLKIRVEGPHSRVYVRGSCKDGKWQIHEGPAAGSYPSANAAVKAVRKHVAASNAYRYVEFLIDGEPVLADRLRYSEDLAVPRDPSEDLALDIARSYVKNSARNAEECEILAERILDENRAIWDWAEACVKLIEEPRS